MKEEEKEEGGDVSILQRAGRSCNQSHNLLFQGKDVMIEELVQFLIGVVDAQLLK